MNEKKVWFYLVIYLVTSFAFTQNTNTWFKNDNNLYGAYPDDNGPIGGGVGYLNIITDGDYVVMDLESLIIGLSMAKSGEVVFIPDEIIIDLTSLIYIEEFVLEIPSGVTLAGNRGYEGSKGALICSDALSTPVLIKAIGSNVRIAGLRIQGPNGKRYLDHHNRAYGDNGKGKNYYYEFPVSRGIQTEYSNLEVDNCDIFAFSHAGINLVNGNGHHIHHNSIHHCQFNGLGYGINQDKSSSIIEYNIFNFNRHSIAGTGRIGCSYIARHNIIEDVSRGHCFDMHGGVDRGDGTNTAGSEIRIHNNTFFSKKLSIAIRGVPNHKSEIFNNWFIEHQNREQAIRAIEKSGMKNNFYGLFKF